MPATPAVTLAQRLSESLLRERIVPRFVDSYVLEHGRFALQVHPTLYRDLLAILQREALLAASVRALEIVTKGSAGPEDKKPVPMKRKDAAVFRQKFLAALIRHQKWNAGDALEFQSDLQMYEAIVARANSARRTRKPFEVANHPFVDRCAFLLDSSFIGQARLAASRTLADLEALAAQTTESVLRPPSSTKLHPLR